jgi:hypothetical protein
VQRRWLPLEAAPVNVPEVLGWIATAVFAGSYFFSQARALRAAQMLGAALWIVYGCLIRATPVIAANALVLAAAAWTLLRGRPEPQKLPGI